MEIISYVGYNRTNIARNSNSLTHFTTLFRNKASGLAKSISLRGIANNRDFYQVDFNRENDATLFSVGNFARDVLKTLARPMDLLTENLPLVLLSLVLSVAVITSTVFYSNNFNYSPSMKTPLVLDSAETVDLKSLNNLMSKFALSENPGYNSDGTLEGAEINLKQIFTQPLTMQTYRVRSGDTISKITRKFGLKNISTLIGVNDIDNVRQLAAGQKLKIPSTDGLFITVEKGNSIEGIASKYNISVEELLDINELEDEILQSGQRLFIPGARLDRATLQNAMGELFKMPITAKFRYSSMFGSRFDPITGAKSTHKGIDMACPTGTPILAASTGTVAVAGYSNLYGNYVVIKHTNGYQTLYAHMSKILAKKGQWVSQGTRIGLVGSTGYSTGPHLHFTVYKNGSPIDPLSVLNK